MCLAEILDVLNTIGNLWMRREVLAEMHGIFCFAHFFEKISGAPHISVETVHRGYAEFVGPGFLNPGESQLGDTYRLSQQVADTAVGAE